MRTFILKLHPRFNSDTKSRRKLDRWMRGITSDADPTRHYSITFIRISETGIVKNRIFLWENTFLTFPDPVSMRRSISLGGNRLQSPDPPDFSLSSNPGRREGL